VRKLLTLCLLGGILTWHAGSQFARAAEKGPPAGAAKAEKIAEQTRPFYFLGPHLFPYNARIVGLIAGDMNADGKLDLAFVDNRMSKIQMLLQKSGEEQDTPAAPDKEDVNKIEPDRLLKKGDFLTNQQVAGYALLRVDKGGPRIVYYCRTKELFVAAREDDGVWRNQQRFLLDLESTFCGGLEPADLNGDGRDDLVFLGEDDFLLLFQKEDGLLAEPKRFPVAEQKSSGLRVGDVDGDGRDDFLFLARSTRYPLRVRLTGTDGAPGPEYRFRMPPLRDVVIGDADNDGRNEIVLIEATTNRVKVYRWHVAKKEKAGTFDFGTVRLVPLPKDEGVDLRDFAVADFDGNGLPDVLFTQPRAARMTLIRSEKGKGLGAPESFPSLQEARRIVVGSVGAPAGPKVFFLSRKEEMIGVSHYDKEAGRFPYPQPLDLPGKPQNMAVRPAGKDGPEALICILEPEKKEDDEDDEEAALEIAVVEASEDGYRVASRQEAPGLKDAPERLLAVDVNADGRTDLLALRSYGAAALLLQNAEGKFEDATEAPQFRKHLLRDLGRASVATGPLRKGEEPLLLLCEKNLARAVAFENGNLVVKDQYSSLGASADFKAVNVGDLDGDGVAEILLVESKGDLLYGLKRNEKGVFESVQQLEIGPFAVLGLLRLDLDGDKSDEVLVVGREKLGVLSRTGASPEMKELASIETEDEDVRYVQALVTDLNADGRNDIILRDAGENQIEIYARNAEGEWKSEARFKVFEARQFSRMMGAGGLAEPRELIAADLTGDGLADLAVIVHDRVIVYPQQK